MNRNILSTLLLSTFLVQTVHAQTITTPANTPLTIEGDLNFLAGKSILAGTAKYLPIPTSGNTNVLLGVGTGNATSSGSQNTMMGHQAGFVTTSSANTFLGFQAGRSNTTGQYNNFIGVNAGINNTTGNSNFMLGTNAGSSNTTGTANFFVGDNAGGANTTGGFNVFLGTNSGTINTVGSNNTIIGFESNLGSGGLVNATAVGFRAVVNASNSVVLGNGANVGIGTSAPAAKLEVVSGSAGVSGLRLTNIGTTATALNQTKFLTVNAAGDVVLGSPNSSGRIGADTEGVWKTDGDNIQNTNAGGVVIGSGVARTPVGYKLYVAGGVLTEKVKVAVKSKSEWSDKVFERGYRLRGLGEVERYVNREKHLPGVPSAQEVVTSGVDVGQMQATLLEKVEELTLYVIELKKQNRRLEKRVNKLQAKSHK